MAFSASAGSADPSSPPISVEIHVVVDAGELARTMESGTRCAGGCGVLPEGRPPGRVRGATRAAASSSELRVDHREAAEGVHHLGTGAHRLGAPDIARRDAWQQYAPLTHERFVHLRDRLEIQAVTGLRSASEASGTC